MLDKKVLIIEDDPDIGDLLEMHEKNMVSTADIQHGCRLWIDSLENEVRESLLADLRLWLNQG